MPHTRFFHNREESKGKAPGSLVFIGAPKMQKTLVRVFDYVPEDTKEDKLEDIEALNTFLTRASVTWVNIDGLQDTNLIGRVGEIFKLHPLMLEDILDTTQRPKVEVHEGQLFMVAKMVRFDDALGKVIAEQLSIVVGHNFVLSFQEQRGDVFEPVRERLRTASTRIRHRKADYLAYALLDTVLDNYLTQIERLGERVEDLDDNILHINDRSVLDRIRVYKQEMNYMRRWVRPQREMVMALNKQETTMIQKETRPYLKDLDDMATYAYESVETYQEMLREQVAIFDTLSSSRLNSVMKVLTVISVIFMPMSFLAGVYGTNFEHMPEMDEKWAYGAFWAMELFLGLGLFFFFRWRKWL